MQCPSCGFENIPGLEKCCACSTVLASERKVEDLRPPRARDRTARQWLAWTTRQRSRGRSIGEGVSGAYSSASRYRDSFHTTGSPLLSGLRDLRIMLISVIPGLGHICVFDQPRKGFSLLISALAALVLAALLYKTPISNWLLFCALLISMYSVYYAADRRFPMVHGRAGNLSRAAIILFIIAAYLGIYNLLVFAFSPLGILVNIQLQPVGNTLIQGDSVWLSRDVAYNRGDLIVGTSQQNDGNIGPVIGMPGDRISFSDRVYVNGIPNGGPIPRTASTEFTGPSEAEITLSAGEYWVMPGVTEVGDLSALAEAGRIRANEVWGRAVVVVNPPAHRRILGAE